MLDEPPPMRCITTNDDTTISISLTIYTRMDTVKANIGNMENSANFMNHMLKYFLKEFREDFSPDITAAADEGKANNDANNEQNSSTETSTTVIGAPNPVDQVK